MAAGSGGVSAAHHAFGRGGAAWEVRSAVREFRRAYGESLRSASRASESPASRTSPSSESPASEGSICVGLSGGADSLALTAAAVAEFSEVTALVVDHGLQAGSAQVAEEAADAARALGAQATVLSVEVRSAGVGPEAAAREARYAALDSARAGRPVLLAHTLDDQAETVLLGLGRGSGAHSLRGMAAWSEPWGRPLLGVRAATTRAACAELGLAPWDDPHNADPTFARVRIRREVLPLLEEILGGGVAGGLARTAHLLRADDDELERLTDSALAALRVQAEADSGSVEPPAVLDIAALEGLPPPVLMRVLRRWLMAGGVSAPTFAHLSSVAALVTQWHGQGPVAVGGEMSVGSGFSGDGPGPQPRRLVAERRHGKLLLTLC